MENKKTKNSGKRSEKGNDCVNKKTNGKNRSRNNSSRKSSTSNKPKQKRNKPGQCWAATMTTNCKNTLFKILRMRVPVLYKSIKINSTLFRVFKRTIFKRYIYMDKLFQSLIISNEKGLGASPHMHLYMKTKFFGKECRCIYTDSNSKTKQF